MTHDGVYGIHMSCAPRNGYRKLAFDCHLQRPQAALSLRFFEQRLRNIPGQQFCDAIDRVIGNAREHLAQIGFGIQAVQLSRTNESAIARSARLAALLSISSRPSAQ